MTKGLLCVAWKNKIYSICDERINTYKIKYERREIHNELNI
jgi:hypothetical protein